MDLASEWGNPIWANWSGKWPISKLTEAALTQVGIYKTKQSQCIRLIRDGDGVLLGPGGI